MTKRTRLIILLVCVACFSAIAPILVLYSMGDRFDFAKMKITATGGIYVRTFPAADQVIVDSKTIGKPGLFSNSVFVQSLLPDDHIVLIKKIGYYDYSKTLPVQEKEVTKLENVLLFKKNIQFEIIPSSTKSPFAVQDKFLIKNSNLYYSNAPENSALSATQKATPILKKIVAFTLQNNNIIWLGTDGLLYKSDLANLSLAPTKITLTAIKISKTGSYSIIANDKNIFINSNGGLLILNTKTSNLDNFYAPVKGAVISPDGKNIVYYDDKNVYISSLPSEHLLKTTLYKSSDKIGNCLWINNSYIVFTAGEKIVISEIDHRGNINIVTLPQTAVFPGDPAMMSIEIKNPKIYFSTQLGKLYILTDKTLLLSEKIIP